MNFGEFSYLISIIIFAGIPLLIEIRALGKYFVKYKKIILVFMIFSIPVAIIGEWVALKWRVWEYVDGSTFGIYLGSAIETIIFLIFVSVCIAVPTLYCASSIDRGISIYTALKNSIRRIWSHKYDLE